jgi:chemotaxis protein methyltransferase CheR
LPEVEAQDKARGMNRDLTEIVRVMGMAHGRDISLHDDAFLAKSIERRLTVTGIKTAAAYGGYLSESSMEAENFSRTLNITYSEFFRNPLTFALLEKVILPGLVAEAEKAGRAELRVWSAACAAGQEAYSIAILLDELAAVRGRATPYRSFATDRSHTEIVAAQAGVYDYASVQNVRLKHIRDYFTQEGESYRVIPALRGCIAFSVYDLLAELSASPPPSIYGDFDLVVCSNLLFYYRADVRQRILNKVWNSLSATGYLITGEAEKEIVIRNEGFRAAIPLSAVFQKTRRRR